MIAPERRSSKVPVVPRERRATSRPRAATASQQAVTSFRCFPREHDQWNQGEWPRAARTWQQCRGSWPGEGSVPQGIFPDFVIRGARKQDSMDAQASVPVRSPEDPKNPIPGRRWPTGSAGVAQAALVVNQGPETRPIGQHAATRAARRTAAGHHFGGGRRSSLSGKGLLRRGSSGARSNDPCANLCSS